MATIISGLTPTPKSEKNGYHWPSRPGIKRHKVSFSGSSKGSLSNGETTSSSSRSVSPNPVAPVPTKAAVNGDQPWQVVDRQLEAVYVDATIELPEARPFLVYDDAFVKVLGATPTTQVLIEDRRNPYFWNSGVFNAKTNTLYLASAPIPDWSPSAAPSKNLAVILSKVEFFERDFARDKVRTGEHSFMFSSGCSYGGGIVMCVQGDLKNPACLLFMEPKRPHPTRVLLTNYMNTPLNSPNSCVAHADGSIWFSDPINTRWRPKAKLPPMIYRFDPRTSDLRAMTDEVRKPTILAFSPSCKTLYVVDSSVYAFTVLLPYGFLTQKRLFVWTDAKAICVDISGNVYIALEDCIQVHSEAGTLIGKINIENVTGLCFGRDGRLFASAGQKLWEIRLDTMGATLKV